MPDVVLSATAAKSAGPRGPSMFTSGRFLFNLTADFVNTQTEVDFCSLRMPLSGATTGKRFRPVVCKVDGIEPMTGRRKLRKARKRQPAMGLVP